MTLLLTVLLLSSLSAYSQQTQKEENDSLVRLLTASRAQLMDVEGKSFRKVEGDVMFLHNNTYLYCDTALWCVEDECIDAVGHVQIVQDNAILSSDKLHYEIRENLATFRGFLVQLEDRDSNILRTNNLDYNTKDSVALFRGGGSMRDKDGNVIEGMRGKFESKENLFTFSDNVEMYSDTMFFACDELRYESRLNKATFLRNTKGWYGRNHIRSSGGWYDREHEKVFFDGGVYIQTEEYEAWCRELLYDRRSQNVKMYRDVELLDTIHNAMVTGGFIDYYNEPRKAVVTENPALIGIPKESGKQKTDTLFLRADTLVYESVKKYLIPSEVAAQAEERLKNLETDVIENKRANDASDAAAQAAANERERKGPGGMAPPKGKGKPPSGQGSPGNGVQSGASPVSDTSLASPSDPVKDSIPSAPADSVARLERMAFVCDSLSIADSLFVFDSEFAPDSVMIAAMDSVVKNWKDTTQIAFLHAWHDVRMYRRDMQMVSDSLEYSDLDSIARLYVHPVVWKDITTQLKSDSMQFVIRNGSIERGIMLSEAMIVSEQVPDKYYNQIKSPEMIGFFNKDGSSLRRFDAIGGIQANFFIEEDSVVTTMNHKEAKIMSASFRKGKLNRVLYLDGIKSDAYPVWVLWKNERDKMKLKGFEWLPEERPKDRYAITSQMISPSVRETVRNEKQFPLFEHTAVYFRNYMEDILRRINEDEPIIWIPRDSDSVGKKSVKHKFTIHNIEN